MALPDPFPPHLHLLVAPLPVVEVHSLDDVEKIARHGAPSRIVFLQVRSLDEARAMVSALRAKRLLVRNPHGGGFLLHDEHFAEDVAHAEAADVVDGFGFAMDDPELLEKFAPDADILDRLLLDDDDASFAFAAAGFHGADGGGNFVAADGWDIAPLPLLHAADHLGRILDEIVADTLPRLTRNLADETALRRLRVMGRNVRRIGKENPQMMGHAPVALGNYLKNVVTKAFKRGENELATFVGERRGTILVRVMELCDHAVSFIV